MTKELSGVALTENSLYGTIVVCQAFVPPMVKAGRGSVITIGSAAAQFGVANGVIYAALKAAVIHYTRCLSLAADRRGPRKRGEPARDQDGALRGDARRRSPEDGFLREVVHSLRRARRDRRRGPCKPEKQVHQRPGPSGQRRRDAVSRLSERERGGFQRG